MAQASANWFRDAKLAKVIEQELGLILAGASDARLHEIEVVRVEAQPGGRHFYVHFGPPPGADRSAADIAGPKMAKDLLLKAKGYIRAELIQVLNLKKAPDISFVPDAEKWAGGPNG